VIAIPAAQRALCPANGRTAGIKGYNERHDFDEIAKGTPT